MCECFSLLTQKDLVPVKLARNKLRLNDGYNVTEVLMKHYIGSQPHFNTCTTKNEEFTSIILVMSGCVLMCS